MCVTLLLPFFHHLHHLLSQHPNPLPRISVPSQLTISSRCRSRQFLELFVLIKRLLEDFFVWDFFLTFSYYCKIPAVFLCARHNLVQAAVEEFLMAWCSYGCTSLLKDDFAEMTLWTCICIAVKCCQISLCCWKQSISLSADLCEVKLGSQNQGDFSPPPLISNNRGLYAEFR